MLVSRKGNIKKTVSVLQYYNGAQTYEQFVLVGRLYRALTLLALALLSPERLCIFDLHGAVYMVFFGYIFLLPFSELSLVGLALDLVD